VRYLERPVERVAVAGLLTLTLTLGGAAGYAESRFRVPGSWFEFLETSESALSRHAGEYAALVAALGAHDADSVDGPVPAGHPPPPLATVSREAQALAAHLRRAHLESAGLRVTALAAQLDAIALRADHLAGRTLSFTEELHRLLRVEATVPQEPPRLDDLHARLERLLPGTGSLSRRLTDYERGFVVPRGRLDAVVRRAVAACRAQTVRHIALPPDERLDVEYVADRPWSGYSVYRGGFRSTMQINRVFPLSVDQILNLACHEGYPGHHVHNVVRDRDLARGRGWPEAAVLPVFSPEGFRAEAIATAAAALVFSREERITLFRQELFPLAGHDAADVERYVDVRSAIDELSTEVAAVVTSYLEGTIDRDDAALALRRQALMEHPEATLAFVDRYRAYALAYTYGRVWLQSELGADNPDRWHNLARLLVSPSQAGSPRKALFLDHK
jgi:hypothetical protein